MPAEYSEHNFQGKLKGSRTAHLIEGAETSQSRRQNLLGPSEVGIPYIAGRVIEIRMVEDIKGVHSGLQLPAFREPEFPAER